MKHFPIGFGDSAVLWAQDAGYKTGGKATTVPPIGWLVPLKPCNQNNVEGGITNPHGLTHIGVIFEPDVGFQIVSPGWIDQEIAKIRKTPFALRFKQNNNENLCGGSAA